MRSVQEAFAEVSPPARRLVGEFWDVWKVSNLVSESTRPEVTGLGEVKRNERCGTKQARRKLLRKSQQSCAFHAPIVKLRPLLHKLDLTTIVKFRPWNGPNLTTVVKIQFTQTSET